MTPLKFPAPYIGGKSKIAPLVWAALAQPDHYMEPFLGSGAVLLARPDYDSRKHIETVNDMDCHIANVYRSLQYAPEEVACYCDWPVNHCDLNARRRVLNEKADLLRTALTHNPDWCHPKFAGYWIYCQSSWIGSGMTSPNAILHISRVERGAGSLGQIPFLAGKKKGVCAETAERTIEWLRNLRDRLRRVRVVCGDWSQICGGNWQHGFGTVGIFFDPPYSVTDRGAVYAHEDFDVAKDVVKWAIPHAENPAYRIVIAGYSGEHPALLEAGWREVAWKASGGYGNIARNGKKSRGQTNRFRERLWFSPHCLNPDQGGLFDEHPVSFDR